MDMRAPDSFRRPAANPEWALAISDLGSLEQISRGAKKCSKTVLKRDGLLLFFSAQVRACLAGWPDPHAGQ
jgi:hypothetical protein